MQATAKPVTCPIYSISIPINITVDLATNQTYAYKATKIWFSYSKHSSS